ncbi:MAG: hypothetical protein V4501_05500 [Pseudomonadota bacterium]
MPVYVKIPYPANFYQKGIEDNYSSIINKFDFPSYDQPVINRLLSEITAYKDLGRTHLKLGEMGMPLAFVENGRTLSHQEIFLKVAAAAKQQDIVLSLEEIQAIFAFSFSINGKALQGGYFKVTEIPLLALFTMLGHQFMREGPGLNSILQVKKENGEIIVVNHFQAKEIYNYQAPAAEVLVIKKETFIIRENKGSFTLAPGVDREDDFLIEENFFNNCLVPAALRVFAKKLEIIDYFNLAPLLINPQVRPAYCESLAKQSLPIQWWVFEYLHLCFFNNLKLKLAIVCTPCVGKLLANLTEQLAKTNLEPPSIGLAAALSPKIELVTAEAKAVAPVVTEVTTTLTQSILLSPEQKLLKAQQDLSLVINTFKLSALQKSAAYAVITAINELNPEQRNKNFDLLTHILEHTTIALKSPENSENLANYQLDIQFLENQGWRNLTNAMAIIFFSAVVITLSTIVACTTLASASLFFGTNLLTETLAILSGILSLKMMSEGWVQARNYPLMQVTNATSSFFQLVKPNKPDTDLQTNGHSSTLRAKVY